jgi:DNA replication protein DnaC
VLRPVPSGRQDRAARSDASCPLGRCDGSGWLWLEDDPNTSRPCECLERRKSQAVSGRMGSGIPKRFRGVSFDRKPISDLHPMVLRQVRKFVRDIDDNVKAGRGMWFSGDVGTGKTSLAMLISMAARDAGRSVAIYSVPHLLADIKETYDDSSTVSYMSLFKRLTSVDLLHLDDLGAERRTEWVLEQLYSIVNERWQNERSILVTSNITDLDELREQVGWRTVSRLIETCGDAIPIMGRDLRMPELGLHSEV